MVEEQVPGGKKEEKVTGVQKYWCPSVLQETLIGVKIMPPFWIAVGRRESSRGAYKIRAMRMTEEEIDFHPWARLSFAERGEMGDGFDPEIDCRSVHTYMSTQTPPGPRVMHQSPGLSVWENNSSYTPPRTPSTGSVSYNTSIVGGTKRPFPQWYV